MTEPPEHPERPEPRPDDYPVEKLERESVGLPPLSDDFERKPADPPPLVRLSVLGWLAAAAVLVIGFVLMIVMIDDIADAQVEAWEQALREGDRLSQFDKNVREVTAEDVRSGTPGLVWLLAVGGIMLAGLLVVFGYRVREGTRSARSVLFAITALIAAFVIVMPDYFVNYAHWAAVAIAAAALVPLFLPQVAGYFPKLPRTRRPWREQ